LGAGKNEKIVRNGEKRNLSPKEAAKMVRYLVPEALVLLKGKSNAKVIYEHAVKQHTNLIVVGARGKGAWASLLGSVTVQLIKKDMYIPLLILRRKSTKKNG